MESGIKAAISYKALFMNMIYGGTLFSAAIPERSSRHSNIKSQIEQTVPVEGTPEIPLANPTDGENN